jgi:hypothetical protein
VQEMLDKHGQEGSRTQQKLPEQRAAADSSTGAFGDSYTP